MKPMLIDDMEEVRRRMASVRARRDAIVNDKALRQYHDRLRRICDAATLPLPEEET